LAVLYAVRWLKVWTWEEWSRFRFIQVGAGIGILLLLLHSLADFNLHIPANVVYFAFLAGVFFAQPGGSAGPVRRRSHSTPAKAMSEPASSQEPTSRVRRHVPPPPDQIRNPFLDDD
jgi:hypothetical protein